MELTAPRVSGIDQVRTPALVIDLDALEANIATTIRLLGSDAGRWRPHLKTAKLALTMRRIREAGVAQAKCSTTLELETACEEGFADVLLAYPVTGPLVETVKQIAADLKTPIKKLYYHVNLLEEHGLIRITSTRVVSGIIEKQYRVTAYRLSVERALRSWSPRRLARRWSVSAATSISRPFPIPSCMCWTAGPTSRRRW